VIPSNVDRKLCDFANGLKNKCKKGCLNQEQVNQLKGLGIEFEDSDTEEEHD